MCVNYVRVICWHMLAYFVMVARKLLELKKNYSSGMMYKVNYFYSGGSMPVFRKIVFLHDINTKQTVRMGDLYKYGSKAENIRR